MLCLKNFQENINQYILINYLILSHEVKKTLINVRKMFLKLLRLNLDTPNTLDQCVCLLYVFMKTLLSVTFKIIIL